MTLDFDGIVSEVDAMAPMTRATIALVAGALRCDMETGPWIAGSAAMAFAYGGVPLAPPMVPSDVDVFFRDEAQLDAAKATLTRLGFRVLDSSGLDSETCAEDIEEGDGLHGKSYVYISGEVRINLAAIAFWPSAAEVIGHFDITVCQVVTDGETFKVGLTTRDDGCDKVIRLARETRTGRIQKYIAKGYKLPDDEVFIAKDSPGRWRSDFSLCDSIRAAKVAK